MGRSKSIAFENWEFLDQGIFGKKASPYSLKIGHFGPNMWEKSKSIAVENWEFWTPEYVAKKQAYSLR